MPINNETTKLNDKIKALFILITADPTLATGDSKNPTIKDAIIAKSKEADFNDKIFFLTQTKEIITHGQTFGASKEVADEIAALQFTTKALTGMDNIPSSGSVIISDTSVIGNYVKAHTISSIKENEDKNNPIHVTSSIDEKNGTAYTLEFDVSKIVDGKTVTAEKNGKISTAVKLVKKYTTDDTPTDKSVFSDTKVDGSHPVILLTKNDGTVLDIVDGNEFITDGMLSSVAYKKDENGKDINNIIVFTWNTDAGIQSSEIDLSKVFNVENIHSANDYLKVAKEMPGQDVDKDKASAYHLTLNVSTNDYADGTIQKTKDNNTKYQVVIDEDKAHTNTYNSVINSTDSEVADAKIVAKKIKSLSDKVAELANERIDANAALGTRIDDVIGVNGDTLDDKLTLNALKNKSIANEKAIVEINSESTDLNQHPNSVSAKIEALRKSLKTDDKGVRSEIKVGDKVLASVNVKQVDGIVTNADLVIKKGSIMTTTPDGHGGQASVTVKSTDGNEATFYEKGIDQIINADPAFVTIHDAYVYGKCIMAQTIANIKDDTNHYIHIDNDGNSPVIHFEPWATIATYQDLVNLDKE